MWFDGQRQPNTIYVASTSRGKDSTAMLRAIQLMGWPLDMICAVDIWATQDIPAELPPMVAFKDEYDQKVMDWFGIPVTRLCATKRERERDCGEECHSRRLSYADVFYYVSPTGQYGTIKGFPGTAKFSWCKRLKMDKVDLRGHILSATVPAERERERERRQNLRFPASQGDLVSIGPQASRNYGFPSLRLPWCNGELKRGAFTVSRLVELRGATASSRQGCSTTPRQARARRAKNKYRALCRDRGRRAAPDR